MKTQYDAEIDALYVRFSDRAIEDSEEIAPGIVLDYDDQHKIVALKILDARAKMAVGVLSDVVE